MAVTGNKKIPEAKVQSGVSGYVDPKANGFNGKPKQTANPYAGMVGVSANTAQHVGQAQQGYQQGQNVTNLQDAWNEITGQKPGEYTSKYDGVIQGILQQIQNPQEFKYEFNKDGLFKGYADLYTQKAKQGMMDAMGQAAGLTGGYGNSYASMVGQQQFQQNMLPLYEKGLELRDRAYQEHQDQYNNLLQQYNVFSNQENTDYGRYQDALANWRQDEATAYGHYQDAANMDYQMYQNDLNYWTGLAQVENQAYQTEQQRQDALAQYKQQYAWQQCQQILANGQMPSAALLAAAGLSAADAAAMMAMMEPAGGGGGGGGGNQSGPSAVPHAAAALGGMAGAAQAVANNAQLLPGIMATQNMVNYVNNKTNYLEKLRKAANNMKE